MYADRKKIPLKDVRIRLSHRRMDSAQGPRSETAIERTDAIDGTIQLEGDLSAAQRRRLLEIAARCHMHRTLSAGVNIRFRSHEKTAGSYRQTATEIVRPDVDFH